MNFRFEIKKNRANRPREGHKMFIQIYFTISNSFISFMHDDDCVYHFEKRESQKIDEGRNNNNKKKHIKIKLIHCQK